MDNIAKVKEADYNIPITMDDFEEALKNIQKSVSEDNLKEFEEWTAEFASV